jgi:hypothetical protein
MVPVSSEGHHAIWELALCSHPLGQVTMVPFLSLLLSCTLITCAIIRLMSMPWEATGFQRAGLGWGPHSITQDRVD